MQKFVNNPFLINISAVILDDVHEETYEYSEIMTLLDIVRDFTLGV